MSVTIFVASMNIGLKPLLGLCLGDYIPRVYSLFLSERVGIRYPLYFEALRGFFGVATNLVTHSLWFDLKSQSDTRNTL